MTNKNTDRAIEFQEEKLLELSKLTYSQLSDIKGRIEIQSPENLRDYQFAQEIKSNDNGGLEVNVFHYFIPSNKIQENVKKLIGETNITFGESKMCRWFDIDSKGNISWPSYELDDNED